MTNPLRSVALVLALALSPALAERFSLCRHRRHALRRDGPFERLLEAVNAVKPSFTVHVSLCM
jgi:hypothetical protein